REERGANRLDGGAPYYAVYPTADGGYIALGAIEPQFFAEFCERVGVRPELRRCQSDVEKWPELFEEFARIFRSRTTAEWTARLEGTDACCARSDAVGSPASSAPRVAPHVHGPGRHRATGAGASLLPDSVPNPGGGSGPRIDGGRRARALELSRSALPAAARIRVCRARRAAPPPATPAFASAARRSSAR